MHSSLTYSIDALERERARGGGEGGRVEGREEGGKRGRERGKSKDRCVNGDLMLPYKGGHMHVQNVILLVTLVMVHVPPNPLSRSSVP